MAGKKEAPAQGEDIAKLGVYIREARRQHGWSIRDLDKASGVSANYIFSIEKPGDSTRRPGAEVIGRLADALELDLNDLYQAVGWRHTLDESPDTAKILKVLAPRPELKTLLVEAKDLSPEQLEMLINLAKMQRRP
jgi:transcriptional regulator with XRE-family HTH domain